MKTYSVHVQRDGDWWGIDIPEVDGGFSQAKRLDQVEAMAREVVALLLDVPEDSFELDVSVAFPPDWAQMAARVQALRKAAGEAESTLGVALREAAAGLRAAGLPVRDVGRVLGISAQRISQLTQP